MRMVNSRSPGGEIPPPLFLARANAYSATKHTARKPGQAGVALFIEPNIASETRLIGAEAAGRQQQ
jgi:hypothetical protein